MRLIPLLLITASCAGAQSPEELLRLTQATYLNPNGYQIEGKGTVQPPGSSWRVTFGVHLMEAASLPGDDPARSGPVVRTGGPFQWVNEKGGADEKPSSVSMLIAVTGFWTRIAENVESVTETGSETLTLNGAPAGCRVLKVQYKAPPDGPKPSSVTYSICSDKHLVLKKVIDSPIGYHAADPVATWTVTFESAKFSPPPPQWLAERKEFPSVETRKEWIGLPAPEFTLADLDGKSVALSSLRGKAVLLDFWSTSCAPCVRELPMIESLSAPGTDGAAPSADSPGDKAKTGKLVVWGISEDPASRDKKWLADHQRKLATLTDVDYAVSDLYKVHGIPATVLIGADGKITNYWQGEVAQADLEAAIKRAGQN